MSPLSRWWLRRRHRGGEWAALLQPPPAGEWVSLDLETTGLDPSSDHILSLAAVPVRHGRVLLSERFERRIGELAGDAVPAERIVVEAAAMASRADVREEIDRLTAHVAAGRALLADGAAAGRRFDFLAQEFMREANTLCSKSSDIQLTRIGLELKTIIDQFREQVQNVE